MNSLLCITDDFSLGESILCILHTDFKKKNKNKKQKWGRGINIDQSLAFLPHQYIMDVIQVSMYGSTSFLIGHRVSHCKAELPFILPASHQRASGWPPVSGCICSLVL